MPTTSARSSPCSGNLNPNPNPNPNPSPDPNPNPSPDPNPDPHPNPNPNRTALEGILAKYGLRLEPSNLGDAPAEARDSSPHLDASRALRRCWRFSMTSAAQVEVWVRRSCSSQPRSPHLGQG